MQCPDCKAEINLDDKLDVCDDCGYDLSDKYNDPELTKINELNKINDEINEMHNLYEQIIVLKNNIDNTNKFNNKSIEKRKEYIKAKNELEKLIKEQRNFDYMNAHMINPKTLRMKEEEFNNMRRELLYLEDDSIHHKYNTYINNNDCFDCDIKFYKLIIYNLEQKAKLKELLKNYYNEETIKLILTELYEKKINLLLMD